MHFSQCVYALSSHFTCILSFATYYRKFSEITRSDSFECIRPLLAFFNHFFEKFTFAPHCFHYCKSGFHWKYFLEFCTIIFLWSYFYIFHFFQPFPSEKFGRSLERTKWHLQSNNRTIKQPQWRVSAICGKLIFIEAFFGKKFRISESHDARFETVYVQSQHQWIAPISSRKTFLKFQSIEKVLEIFHIKYFHFCKMVNFLELQWDIEVFFNFFQLSLREFIFIVWSMDFQLGWILSASQHSSS